MMSYFFYHQKGGIHGLWSLCHFSSQSGYQKYIDWFPESQPQAPFAMWCLLLKKHTNFLNQTVTLDSFYG